MDRRDLEQGIDPTYLLVLPIGSVSSHTVTVRLLHIQQGEPWS